MNLADAANPEQVWGWLGVYHYGPTYQGSRGLTVTENLWVSLGPIIGIKDRDREGIT